MKPLLTRIPGAAKLAIVCLLALPLAANANDHKKHKHHHDHDDHQSQGNGHKNNSWNSQWNNQGNNHWNTAWSYQGNNHWDSGCHQRQIYYGQNCPAPSVAGIILSLVSGFNSAPPVRQCAPPPQRVRYDCGIPRAHSVESGIQLALARAGYYRGSIDGCLGPSSREAIACYQVDHGLPVTGYPTRSLLCSLGL